MSFFFDNIDYGEYLSNQWDAYSNPSDMILIDPEGGTNKGSRHVDLQTQNAG
jgi:hypothetical protein